MGANYPQGVYDKVSSPVNTIDTHRKGINTGTATTVDTEVIFNNTKYRHHTDPLFKRNNIVKVSDLYKLQVFSFMYDLVNNKLPGSFDDFIPITNESNYVILPDSATEYT